MKKVTLAITGASGMPFAIGVLNELLKQGSSVNVVISNAGLITFAQECGFKLSSNPSRCKQILITHYGWENYAKHLSVYASQDWYAPIASGSSVDDVMIVCPCSMATLGKIAAGIGEDLITRAADVCLKERKNLIIVPRETPLSAIHLENMLKLAKLGVSVIPPVPAFYAHPKSIADIVDFIVARILDQAGVANNLALRW